MKRRRRSHRYGDLTLFAAGIGLLALLAVAGALASHDGILPYIDNTPLQSSPTPPNPTATINAGSGNGVSRTVVAGFTITIDATYAAANGDTLTASAINGNDQVTSVPCVNIAPYNASCWTQPDTAKTYSYTPNTNGTYHFYAAAKSAAHASYANYASVGVTVVTPPTDTIWQSKSTTAPNETFTVTWSSSNAQSCIIKKRDPDGTLTTWDTTDSGSRIVALPTAGTYAGTIDCTAYNGTVHSEISHVVQVPQTLPTINSFSASRVRKGAQSVLSWNISGMQASNTCTISPTPASGQISWDGITDPWKGNATTSTLSAGTLFTLRCTDGSISTSSQVTARLTPGVKEY